MKCDWSDPEAVRTYYRTKYKPRPPGPRKEAIRLGLPTYMPLKACKAGHLSERYTRGGCIECQRIHNRERSPTDETRARRRQRYWSDIERSREAARRSSRRQYEKNRETIRARENEKYREQYRLDHPGSRTRAEIAEAAAKRRADKERRSAEHKKKREEQAQTRRDRSRAAMVAFKTRNPDYFRNFKKTPAARAEKRAREIRKRREIIVVLGKAQKGRCAYCRCLLTKASVHIDHIQPRALGGTNDRSNLQLTCSTCNGAKHAKPPEMYAREIGRLL